MSNMVKAEAGKVPVGGRFEGLQENLINGIEYIKEFRNILPFVSNVAYGADRSPSIKNLTYSVYQDFRGAFDGSNCGRLFMDEVILDMNNVFKGNEKLRFETEKLCQVILEKEYAAMMAKAKEYVFDAFSSSFSAVWKAKSIGAKVAKEVFKFTLKSMAKGDINDTINSYLVGKVKDAAIKKLFGDDMGALTNLLVGQVVDVSLDRLPEDSKRAIQDIFSNVQVYHLPQRYNKRGIRGLWMIPQEKDRGYGELFIYNPKTDCVIGMIYQVQPENDKVLIMDIEGAWDGNTVYWEWKSTRWDPYDPYDYY